MQYLQWGERHDSQVKLMRGEDCIAVFDADRATVQSTTAPAIAGEWKLFSADGLKAILPDGRVFTCAGRLGRDKKLVIDMEGATAFAINERKQDWIIDGDHDNKLAQFSGGGHGVRHPILEFEDGVELPEEQQIFLAWVARMALEAKLLSTTTILTICLALLTPFIIWYYWF